MNDGMDHHKDFLDEREMQKEFESAFDKAGENKIIDDVIQQPQRKKAPFYMWYKAGDADKSTYDHHDPIPDGGIYSCETIIDEWWKWFLSTPKQINPFTNPGNVGPDKPPILYSSANAFLFSKKNTFVYFLAGSPFQNPDIRRMVMTERASLLVPVYNIMVSPALYTLKTDEDYIRMMKDDLKAIKKESVVATFDDQPLYGCLTIRTQPLKVFNISKDNVFDIPEDRLKDTNYEIDILHAGFWLLIKRDKFTPGDHVLYFKAQSPNYEMEEKILISALL
ncbi:MAG: hypothetical protein WBQ25_24410 [Nitrososphaeraceae archaeon]